LSRYWKVKVRSTCYTCRLSFMAANKVRGKKVHVVLLILHRFLKARLRNSF